MKIVGTFLYFASAPPCGPIKIGISTKPESRISDLSVWAPYPITLLATCGGSFMDERRLHTRFIQHLLHHEWFHPAREILDVVDFVRRHGSLPAEILAVTPLKYRETPGRKQRGPWSPAIRAAVWRQAKAAA